MFNADAAAAAARAESSTELNRMNEWTCFDVVAAAADDQKEGWQTELYDSKKSK